MFKWNNELIQFETKKTPKLFIRTIFVNSTQHFINNIFYFLQPYENCDRYQQEVKGGPQVEAELEAYFESAEYKAVSFLINVNTFAHLTKEKACIRHNSSLLHRYKIMSKNAWVYKLNYLQKTYILFTRYAVSTAPGRRPSFAPGVPPSPTRTSLSWSTEMMYGIITGMHMVPG